MGRGKVISMHKMLYCVLKMQRNLNKIRLGVPSVSQLRLHVECRLQYIQLQQPHNILGGEGVDPDDEILVRLPVQE